MKILYLTSGATGAGRVVRGIAIGNALKRKRVDCDYAVISGSPFASLVDQLDIRHLDIPLEPVERFSSKECRDTIFYRTLVSENPDIILVDLIWFPLHHFIEELGCKKVFLCRQVDKSFFAIDVPENPISFRPQDYDLVLGIEPFRGAAPMRQINPILLRNRDEILSRERAVVELAVDSEQPVCILSYSGHPGDFERVKKDYSYLESEYQMVYTTTHDKGIFPIVDFYNAADFVVCGAGYNSFWETVYLGKEAHFVPIEARFESGNKRVEEYRDYRFEQNGADQLVDIIIDL
jgi:hypothetical protein